MCVSILFFYQYIETCFHMFSLICPLWIKFLQTLILSGSLTDLQCQLNKRQNSFVYITFAGFGWLFLSVYIRQHQCCHLAVGCLSGILSTNIREIKHLWPFMTLMKNIFSTNLILVCKSSP